MANLVNEIETQCNRVRRAMREYEPQIPNGRVASDVLLGVIKQAEATVAAGDQARMMSTLESLRSIVPWFH